MLTKNILTLIDKEFPEHRPLTKPAPTNAADYTGRYRAAISLAVGLFYSKEDYDKYRTRVLSMPLP